MSNYFFFWIVYVLAACTCASIVFFLIKNSWVRRTVILLLLCVLIPVQVKPEDLINEDEWYVPSIVQSVGVALLGRFDDAQSYLSPIFNIFLFLFIFLIIYMFSRYLRNIRKKKQAKLH